MSNKDLYLLIYSDLRSARVQALNERACSINVRLELAEITGFLDEARDPELLTYLGALLLVKLDRLGPQGPQAIQLLYKACTAIINNNQDLAPSMAYYASSVIANEMMKSDDPSALRWAEAANYISQFQGATTAPTSATNIRFAKLFWPRASQICRNTTGEYVIETLDYLIAARKYGFDLECVSKIIAKAAADFIDERTDQHKNRFNYPPNPDQDYDILQKVKEIGLTNYQLLQSDITRLERIVTKPLGERPVQNVGNPAGDFSFIADNSTLATATPVFLNEQRIDIDTNQIAIINMSFFARQTAHFQVAVHKATYMGHPVAIKMYQAISPDANFNDVEKEIRCYQYLTRLATKDNCFLSYYGSYVNGSSLNLVMDFYEKDLMRVITEKASQKYELNELTAMTICIKLLTSFSEMEGLGIFHGDIKPHNILTDDFWNMKIIDFSVSVMKSSELIESTGVNPVQGTAGYMAPEVEALVAQGKDRGIFSPEKSDVFSLGLVFLQLLTFKKLEDLNTYAKNAELMRMVNSLRYDWAKQLLFVMLSADLTMRPRFRQCLEYVKKVHHTMTMQGR